MKRIASLVTLLTVLILASSCGNNSEKLLNETVKELKQTLPQNPGDDVIWADIQLDASDLFYCYNCREVYENVDETFADKELKKEEIKYNLAQSYSSDLKVMLDALKNTNRGMKYVYRGMKSNSEVTISIPQEEVKSTKWNDLKTVAREYLEQSIRSLNEGGPHQVDEVTIFNNVTIDGDVVSYNHTLIETSTLSIANMQEMGDDVKEYLLPDLNDPSIIEYETLLKEAGCKLRYKYSGSECGEDFVFTVEPLTHKFID